MLSSRELARYLLLRSHPYLLTDAEFKRRNYPGNAVVLFGEEGVLTHRAEKKVFKYIHIICIHRYIRTYSMLARPFPIFELFLIYLLHRILSSSIDIAKPT